MNLSIGKVREWLRKLFICFQRLFRFSWNAWHDRKTSKKLWFKVATGSEMTAARLGSGSLDQNSGRLLTSCVFSMKTKPWQRSSRKSTECIRARIHCVHGSSHKENTMVYNGFSHRYSIWFGTPARLPVLDQPGLAASCSTAPMCTCSKSRRHTERNVWTHSLPCNVLTNFPPLNSLVKFALLYARSICSSLNRF